MSNGRAADERIGQDTMVSSEVEVAVDPDTAFAAFTGELDLWWVRGPIRAAIRGTAEIPGAGGVVRASSQGWGLTRVSARLGCPAP